MNLRPTKFRDAKSQADFARMLLVISCAVSGVSAWAGCFGTWLYLVPTLCFLLLAVLSSWTQDEKQLVPVRRD